MAWGRSDDEDDLEVVDVDLFSSEPGDGSGHTTITMGGPGPRRSLLLGGVAAAAVVLAAVVAAGGSSEDQRSTPTSSPATTTFDRPRPRPSVVPRTTVDTAPLVGPLLGEATGLELVTSFDGRVVATSFDTGATTVLSEPDRVGDVEVAVVPNGVVLLGDDTELVLLRPDGSQEQLAERGGHRVVFSADGSQAWLDSARLDGSHQLVQLPLGDGVDRRLGVPAIAGLAGVTSAGPVVEVEGSGTYLVDEGGARRLASGGFVAAGGDLLASAACDADLTCAVVVAQLDGHEVARVTLPAGCTQARGRFSPDGRLLAFVPFTVLAPTEAEVVVVDVARGAPLQADLHTVVGWPAFGLPLHFSADGRWLLLADRGQLDALDTSTGEVHRDVLDGRPLGSFDLRSA